MTMVDIHGRFGNQLFMYAFAFALRKRTRSVCVFDNTQAVYILPKYFELSSFYNVVLKIPILRRYYRVFCHEYKESHDILCDDIPDVADELDYKYYDGFYQSQKYFGQYLEPIRKRFKVKKKFVNVFQRLYGDVFSKNKVIVMHIRRTDYLTFGKDLGLGYDSVSLPVSYYQHALQQIDGLSQYRIIVIGDDLEWGKRNFSNYPNIYFERNELIVDWLLLLNANVCILSNSTFAYWGGVLNNIKSECYAPLGWLGYYENKEIPQDISFGLNNWHWIK